jgi:hypothetical protein
MKDSSEGAELGRIAEEARGSSRKSSQERSSGENELFAARGAVQFR